MFAKFLVLLALSTIALAGTHGWPWVGSFTLDDDECTNTSLFTSPQAQAPGVHYRPEVRKGICTPITFAYDTTKDGLGFNVGGFWGTGSRQINKITMYQGDNCTDDQWQHNSINRDGDQETFCFWEIGIENPGWKSIMGS